MQTLSKLVLDRIPEKERLPQAKELKTLGIKTAAITRSSERISGNSGNRNAIWAAIGGGIKSWDCEWGRPLPIGMFMDLAVTPVCGVHQLCGATPQAPLVGCASLIPLG